MNVFQMLFYGPLIFSNFLGQKVSVVCSEVNWLPFPFFFVFVFYFSGRNGERTGCNWKLFGNVLVYFAVWRNVRDCFVLLRFVLASFLVCCLRACAELFYAKLPQTGRRQEGSFLVSVALIVLKQRALENARYSLIAYVGTR